MVKKVITNLNSSKASSPPCISVVVLKNCEPCFPDCGKVLSVVPVFKNVGERSTSKNYRPVSFFLWLAKSLKNLYIIVLWIA